MNKFKSFSYKDTHLKLTDNHYREAVDEVVHRRKQLERYIQRQPEFRTALSPITLEEDAPEIAQRMAAAAQQTGLGPMASVAGILAQYGAVAAITAGASHAIVENGGDLYVTSNTSTTIGLYSGDPKIGSRLAIELPATTGLSLCSSSSKMGHSKSFGRCALATVLSENAALADSAATLLGNSVTSAESLQEAVENVTAISGILGALAITDGHIAMVGAIPLVPNREAQIESKITRSPWSNFQLR